MIDFFFGKPRTGKTYRAVKIIYDDYIAPKSNPKYINVLTNIGGFKFDDINEHFKLDYEDKLNACKDDRAKKKINLLSANVLIFDDLYARLEILYDLAMKNEDDLVLNSYADRMFMNDSLIVIDESSFYMKKYTDVISWWLAYHGHFRIRIIVIAQTPKQIYREYMEHTELYYEAQPQSKQLKSNKLRYIIRDDYTFNKESKFGSDSITTSQDIFDLYKSGEVDKPKKMLYKFLLMMFLSIAVMIGLFKFLFYRIAPEADINNIEKNDAHISSTSYEKEEVMSSDTFVFNIRCNDTYCWNNNIKYLNNQITLNHFMFIVKKFDLSLQFYEVKNEIYKMISKRDKRGFEKVVLASLTDFYYEVPNDLKSSYLSDLFILKEIKKSINKLDTGIKDNLFSGVGSDENE